jgi:hypothetical protein
MCDSDREQIQEISRWTSCVLCAVPCAGDNSIDKADIKRLKESGVFGPLTFWVTEIKNLEELGNPNAAVSTLHSAAAAVADSH